MRQIPLWMMAIVLMAGFTACTDDDLLEDSSVKTLVDVSCDGSFQWTRSEDVETRQEFLRNFGVGYSYDAVRGAYCDWRDIRCQVLNRAMLEQLQDETGEPLLQTDLTQSVVVDSKFSYSFRDYVVNMDINSKEEIDLGLYNNTKRKRQHFIEDGVQETYFYTLSQRSVFGHRYVGWANLKATYWKKEEMFTQSFRNAIEHLSKTRRNNLAAVDSFLDVWGTHVIVGARVGATIQVDLRNNMWRWTALAKDSAWTVEEFLDSIATKDERRKTSNEYRWTEHSCINITARGGNQESLTGLLGEHRFDGTRSFSTEGISSWRRSLRYDPDNEHNSNVEMVDMTVIPIWEFADVISISVAQRIKAAVLQDAALMQKLLGDRNFFNASFPVRYPSSWCYYRMSTGSWLYATRTDTSDKPMIVNIMSGGRYVATVCHELINNHDLWVCYPIYEGRIKQACGVGVDEFNNVYKVRWLGGVATTTLMKQMANNVDNFYINGGAVQVEPREGVSYPECKAFPYIELCGGVKPDGGYAASAYNVTKDGESFLLLAPGGKTDIVGFTDTNKTSGDMHIYKRNDNYVYIYNQNEIMKW